MSFFCTQKVKVTCETYRLSRMADFFLSRFERLNKSAGFHYVFKQDIYYDTTIYLLKHFPDYRPTNVTSLFSKPTHQTTSMRVPGIELMKKGTKIFVQPWMFQDLQLWGECLGGFWLAIGWWCWRMFESSGAHWCIGAHPSVEMLTMTK